MNCQKVVEETTLTTALVNRDARKVGRRQFGESAEKNNSRTKVVILGLLTRNWLGAEDNGGRHDRKEKGGDEQRAKEVI